MLDPAGDRASPAGSVHVGVRTSAEKLAPMGWAVDYRYARDDLYFVSTVLYDATNVASTRESYGLDWLLVAGQDVLCGTGATCADVAAPGTGYTCSCTGAGLSGAGTTDEAATCSPVLCAKNEAVTDNACVACANVLIWIVPSLLRGLVIFPKPAATASSNHPTKLFSDL